MIHLIAFPNLLAPILAPIVTLLEVVLTALTTQTHNLGLSLIALAAIMRAAFWPLNTMQFNAMTKMQVIQPQLKALQAKYANDPEKLQAAIMGVYKDNNTNPMAGCIPLMVQLPVLFSVYQAISANHVQFTQTSLGWIGSPWALAHAPYLAANLAAPDFLLLAIYAASMYISVRFSSAPSADPQQAMTQQIMAVVSPLMIAYIGRNWPSGLLLFWLTSNVLQTLQQLYLRRANAAATATASAATDATMISGGARPASPARNSAHSSRRPRKGPRRSSR